MLEKPNLADDQIIACLREWYELPVSDLEFLSLGNDASAWAYRIRAADGNSYFLKVRRGTVNQASLTVPRYLLEQGIGQIVAALPTRSGALCHPLAGFSLILYPFIAGDSGVRLGLSEGQWMEYGAFLRALHAAQLPALLREPLPEETFIPRWASTVRALQAMLAAGDYRNDQEAELAVFWRQRGDEIERLVRRAEELGRALQVRSPEFVLCHADIHTANLLIDQRGGLRVVDWDGLLFAPRERDLMFIGGEPVPFHVSGTPEALFFQGYGEVERDGLALAYYCYEWVVQEIGDYGERVLLLSDIGAATRAKAVEGFRELFRPGDAVESACQAEEWLS